MGITNIVRSVQFGLRERALGRLPLRTSLPKPVVNPQVIAEREFYRHMLGRALGEQGARDVGSVWDIGCRNWSYAWALAEFFPRARLYGVEVDAHRRYWNLHRRKDIARAYTQELKWAGKQAQCLFEDFRRVSVSDSLLFGESAVFCSFFPFVSADPCLSWGLPARYADFASLLKHALSESRIARAKPTFISCHQGEWEAEIALGAYSACGIEVAQAVIPVEEVREFWPSEHETNVLYSV